MPKCDFNKVALHGCSPVNLMLEITLQYECSPVNLMHVFRTPFPKNTSGRLLRK